MVARVVLDSWVVSQIWLDSDSNESSQSRVGRENEGYESSQSRITLIDRHLSQSRITLIVIWVRVESHWSSFESELSQLDTAEALIFLKRNVKILQLSVVLPGKNQPTTTFGRTPPPPGQQLSAKLGKKKCDESWVRFDSTLTQMSWVRVESS